jgi:hypothetical protein
MGTRELLLLILVFIVVAVATTMAILIVQETHIESAKDNVRTQLMSFSAQAHGWAMRPDFIGGGNQSFNGFSWSAIRADSIQPDIEFFYEINDSGKSLTLIGTHALVDDTMSVEVRIPDGISMR